MTQDEIIEMAIEAKLPHYWESGDEIVYIDRVTHFAKLVAQHEREACAEIAEKQRYAMHISLTSHPIQNGTAVGIANAIRARGQVS